MTNNPAPQKFVVTTPLYYVNDVPHIGSAYTTLAADALIRWQRLQGNSALLITGTDEHGQKIERTAISKDLAPQEHCDQIVVSFKSLWEQLNIQYDRFSRTTASEHKVIVDQFFERVWEKGDIYLDQQQGWYCVACEEFKEERELTEDKHCQIHTNKKAEWRDEENYFFRLSKYQKQLEAIYADNPEFIQPVARRNEVLNFVAQGLQDFSISRVNLDWGFPISQDPKHTIYVWFDALLGYLTALLEPDQEANLELALSQGWPIDLHLIGKDILRFHAVYWPAMLLSAELPIPKRVFGHGFLTKDGLKMGKSLGNTLNPFELLDKYGSDAVRYYFLRAIEFGKDGDFNESRFVDLLNADLAKNLGNLLNRTLGMLNKYCQGNGPQLKQEDYPDHDSLKTIGSNLGSQVAIAYQDLQFKQACEAILELANASNKYIDDHAPWVLFKEGKQEEIEHVLYAVLESIRLAAYLLSPIVPNLSNAIYQQLGFSCNFNELTQLSAAPVFAQHSRWGHLPANLNLNKARPVFTQLELSSVVSDS